MNIRSVKTLILLWVALATGVAFYGCDQAEQGPPPPTPEVTVKLPIQKEFVDRADFTGRTEASEYLEIRARVQGFLKAVMIPKQEGSTETWDVKEGDTLFEIEREPFEAELAAANARLEQTKAKLELARANTNRYKILVENKTVSMEEYETHYAEYLVAKAAILVDEAAIEQATIDLGYTRIVSPFSGRASRNLVDKGNLVGASENTLLTTVVKTHPMHVYFDVSEPVVLNYLEWKRKHKEGNGDPTVYLGLANEEGYPHEGKLDYLENQVDPTTGTALIRGVFPNEDGFLYPGLFVRVRVPLDPIEDAVLVEERAIGTDLGGKNLLVVGEDNIVEQRRVELGALDKGMRVILKGISPGEKYIVDGLQRARPGLPVDPQMAEEAEPSAEAKADDGDDPEPPSN